MLDQYKLAAIFVKIADCGSLTRAAAELSVTRPLVSQYLAQLESDLGTKLLHRTTRSLALTEAGARFLEPARQMIASHEAACAAALGQRDQPQGELRISLPHDLTDKLCEPLQEFRALYPDLELELLFDDAIVNLEAERIDVSIRTGWLRDSPWHATKLATTEPWLCAHPKLVANFPTPGEPKDLITWPWIILTRLSQPNRLRLSNKHGQEAVIKVRPVIRTNAPAAMRALILAGAGVGVCLSYQIENDLAAGTLVRVLPAYALRTAGIFAVQPYGKKAPAKVQLLIKFLHERLSGKGL